VVKTVLFHRVYEGFTGGHLKLNDYLSHVDSCNLFKSSIYVNPSGKSLHLWNSHPGLTSIFDPESADILFIAGLDWRAINDFDTSSPKPIINLIQHVRHAYPSDELYTYLTRKAIRICVSQEVADAIDGTGQCNGPIYVIPNGIDFSQLPTRCPKPNFDVVIAGLKRPDLAVELSSRLKLLALKVDCIINQLPRNEYLERISCARIVVSLPHSTEGFYLPALEAMAMKIPLVTLDCVGNRSFCIDGETCLLPNSNPLLVESSILRLLKDIELANTLSANAFAKSQFYNITRERNDFLRILSLHSACLSTSFPEP
jgi:hypothetical protein